MWKGGAIAWDPHIAKHDRRLNVANDPAYEICRTGTLCARTELTIESVPARWTCPDCGRDMLSGELLRCPACRSPARLASGDEIILGRIEMEVA